MDEIKGKILVVDDDTALLALLVDILDLRGFEVVTAGNGLDALKCLEGDRFDVIVSDIEMPVMDGPDFFRHLGEKAPLMQKRVIFATATVNEDTERFLKESGCRYLMKPFKMDAFLRLVEDVSHGETTQEIRVQRGEERARMELECLLLDEEFATTSVTATAVDISPHSLGVRYYGAPLKINEIFKVHLRELDETRRMAVVWSTSIVGNIYGAGFKSVHANA
ncbi:MAG: response regulator [Thermodesulfobacteriota bacterium]